MLSSASDKAKLFAKNFSKNSNLMTLPICLSRIALKLHVISVTRKIVKKVITNLDSSKATSPDCIPVVVLNNCKPELFDKLKSCFSDCWKVSLVVPIFRNVGGKVCS